MSKILLLNQEVAKGMKKAQTEISQFIEQAIELKRLNQNLNKKNFNFFENKIPSEETIMKTT